MNREDVLGKIFDAEFCEPKDKPAKERELQETLAKAADQTGKALHLLKAAILRVYPLYRAKRLASQLPTLPFAIRDK